MAEPFILHSVDRATQWVELCSQGTGFARDKAASMLATLCGFGTWDLMTYAMGFMPPSLPDEDVERAEAVERMKNHMRVLVGSHQLEPATSLYLLNKLPPTSKKQYVPFTMDEGIELTPMQVETIEEFADEFAQSDAAQEYYDAQRESETFATQIEPNRASIAISLSGDTASHLWVDILDRLGWDFDYYPQADDCPDLDEASFVLLDNDGEWDVPVYLSPIAHTPRHNFDQPDYRSRRVQRALCVGDYMAHWQDCSPYALLLQRWPAVKEVNGKHYCHLGSVYSQQTNQWKDLLFNLGCTSFARLLELNEQVEDIHQGHPALEDYHKILGDFATAGLSDIDPQEFDLLEEFVLICQRGTDPVTGWSIQRFLYPDAD